MITELLKNARRSKSGRRLLTSKQKALIVSDWEQSGLSCPEYCRRYNLFTTQLYKWRSDAELGAVMGIKNEGDLPSKAQFDALLKENEALKKALGESTLANSVLKKKLEWDALKNQKLTRYPKSSS